MFEIIVAILIILALAIAAVLMLALRKPDTFRVERAATIDAPPEKIFPLISDFHRWTAWSPWEDRDPDLQRSYSGAASGRGAVYEWKGNRNVGSGRMEILDAPPPDRIVIKLDFMAPFEAHNTAEFTLLPQRRQHKCHMADAWSGAAAVESDAGVHEHGRHDRQGFCRRPRQAETRRGDNMNALSCPGRGSRHSSCRYARRRDR